MVQGMFFRFAVVVVVVVVVVLFLCLSLCSSLKSHEQQLTT